VGGEGFVESEHGGLAFFLGGFVEGALGGGELLPEGFGFDPGFTKAVWEIFARKLGEALDEGLDEGSSAGGIRGGWWVGKFCGKRAFGPPARMRCDGCCCEGRDMPPLLGGFCWM
jgi:hypothetical protein